MHFNNSRHLHFYWCQWIQLRVIYHVFLLGISWWLYQHSLFINHGLSICQQIWTFCSFQHRSRFNHIFGASATRLTNRWNKCRLNEILYNYRGLFWLHCLYNYLLLPVRGHGRRGFKKWGETSTQNKSKWRNVFIKYLELNELPK